MWGKWIATDDLYTIALMLVCRYGVQDFVRSANRMLDNGFIIKVRREDYEKYHD